MKVKTVIIALLVTAAAVGGIGYAVYRSTRGKVSPVNVVPVQNVNYGYWGDSSTMYGSIVAMDSQNVQLNSDYELVKVYVETGDEVKIGDPLLEYDMTLTELKNEMEELTKMGLEINLESMEKELKKLQNTSPTASLELNTGVMTASDDGLLEDGGQVQSNGGAGSSEISGGGQSLTEGTGSGEDTGGAANDGASETVSQGGIDDDTLLDEPAGGQDESEGSAGGEDTPDDSVILGGDDSDGENVADQEEVIARINSFLTRVNQLSTQELDSLIPSDISEALRIFREDLSVSETTEQADVFGDTREIVSYSVDPAVAQTAGEGTALVLQQAYDRVCVYQLIYCMQQLNPDQRSVDEMTDEEVRALEEKIRAAADAWYSLQQGAYSEHQEIIDRYTEQLSAFVARLNHMDVVEETEPSTEPVTEFPSDNFGDFGGFGDGDGMSYTAEELKAAIEEQQRTIKECKLQIRESELKLKQYQRELDNKVVKSIMNGVVKTAGTVDDAVTEDDFIVIAGATGMYVQGTLNELKLDSVKVGDLVQATSYDAGMTFTATITEISPYPVDSDNYYGYGSENTNASYYPFLAYVEDTEGLTEGDAEIQIVESAPSTDIYLEKYFIQEESSGKEYVYIQDENGLLKKQYVQTGIDIYGSATEIRAGLTLQDKIAFPYGKNVVEGAPTQEVDNLFSGVYYG